MDQFRNVFTISDPNPPEKVRERTKQVLSGYVRKRRNALGITQLDLSITLRRGAKYIWRVENGLTEPDLFEFIAIVEALKDDPGIVVGRLAKAIGFPL